ncbi:hypothetical protein [Rhodococcus sp. NPDC049939]|uniref:hypothetical protein n=1 Tax=Rhodococcus sp. NPDC049939 TaxID=3155511 RepID=UPI0034110C12
MNRIEWDIEGTDRLLYIDDNRLSSSMKSRVEKLRNTNQTERVRPVPPGYKPEHGGEGFWSITGGIVFAGIFGPIVGVLFHPIVGWVLVGFLVFIPIALVIFGIHLDKEMVEISKATVVIKLSSFERSGRSDASSSEVTRIASQPFGTDRIDQLLAAAIGISDAIPETGAWSTKYLDAHRVQLNLDEEREQIVQHCLALRIATDRLGSKPVGESAAAKTARDAFAATRKPLDLVWNRLTERVAVLEEYLESLVALDLELEHAETARRALSVDDEIGALLENAVGDEFAAEHMRDLRDQTRAITAAINELVESLDGNLQTLLTFSGTESDHE